MREPARHNGYEPAMPRVEIRDSMSVSWRGVSKREHFAGLALQGLLANPALMTPPRFLVEPNLEGPFEANQTHYVEEMPKLEIVQPDYPIVAEMAVKWADALLEALEEQ